MDSDFIKYNCKDSLVTALSSLQLMDELNENKLMEFYDTIVHPLSRIVINMNKKGIRIDESKITLAIKAEKESIVEMERDLFAITGQVLEVNSSKNIGNYLYNEIGIKNKGSQSTDRDTLLKICEKVPEISEVCHLILDIRNKKKLVSTFLEGMNIGENGKCYPSFRIGPVTGRLAARKPNFQNIPAGISREVFVPHDGNVFIYADYSQIELRIIAILSNDTVSLDSFKKGDDIHSQNARDLFGVVEVSNSQRHFAKSFIYGLIYGGSMSTILSMASNNSSGLSLVNMEKCKERYYYLHPNLIKWRENIELELRSRRKLVNSFGRPRIFFGNVNESIRQAFNFPIQSNAADMLNKKIIEIDNLMPNSLVMQVHDSIMLEVPKSMSLSCMSKVKKILESPVKELSNYSFPVNSKIGCNWGEF
mgnify:CR=1 FL=1